MTANDLLTLVIQLSFIVLGILTTYDYLRHRDMARRDICLMFVTLAATFVIQLLTRITGLQVTWLSRLGSIALVSQPYLLLRLARYFRPIPVLVMRAALVGMLISWTALVLTNQFSYVVQLILLLAMIIYFAAINGYAMITFIRGAFNASGVVRQRLRFTAAGSGLLGGALLSITLVLFFPGQRDLISSLLLIMAFAAALSYYVGFTPPRWLRRAWQLVEFRTFLLRLNSKLWGKHLTAADSMGELCQGAILAVGGTVAAVAHRDVGKNAWQLRHVANCADLVNSIYSADGILERAWRERAPMFILGSGALADHERALLDAAGADTLLVTPIASSERAWGLLLVFLKHSSLFIQDDLELIPLLAQQSAISLENMAL